MPLQIRRVNKDVLPARPAGPGRVRKPSDFDDVLDEAYAAWQAEGDDAWFEVPFDGTKDDFNELANELNRAVIHRDEYGKSIRGGYDEDTDRVTYNEEGTPVFWFQIRDKIKTGPRGPRKKKDENGESESNTNGVGEMDVEEKTGKRSRKTLEANFSG